MRLHKSLKAVALLTALCILLTATVPAFAADVTTTVYMSSGEEKKIEGSVIIPEGKYQDGVKINNYFDNETSLEITGSIQAIQAAILHLWEGVVSLLVGRDVTAKGNNTIGVSIDAISNFRDSWKASTANVIIGGDITAESQNGYSNALTISTLGGESKATVKVGGNVNASSRFNESWEEINGIQTWNQGGETCVEVIGNVNSTGVGVDVANDHSYKRFSLTQVEIDAIKDKLTLGYEDEYGKYYSYTDENGDQYYYDEYNDGSRDSYKIVCIDYEGTTSISVGGDVVAKNDQGDRYIVGISTNNIANGQKSGIIIGGGVTAKGNGNATGITSSASNGGVTDIDISQGTVTVESKESSATGIRMNANGSFGDPEKASAAKLTVGKDVTAKGKYDATGVEGVASNGGVTDIDISRGAVTAESEARSATGVRVNANGSFGDPEKASAAKLTVGKDVTAKGKYDATGVVGKASNGGVADIDISQGAVTVESKETDATGVSMSANGSFDDPSTANLIIGKDVSAKGKGSTKGVVVEASNGGVTNIDISKGAVTVNSEESSATGIRMDANGSYDDPEKASTAKLTIGKDVSATGAKSVYSITGSSTFGSELTIEANGSVTAESENGRGYALTISTAGEKSKATATVTGDVAASGNGNYWENAYAIRMTNYGGDATATVTGGVKSTGTGISTTTEKYSTSFSLTQQEIEAIKDKLILVNDNGNRKYYSYTDENGDQYKYYEYNDGYSYGYKYINREYAGTTSVTVGGNVVAENNGVNRSVTGISAYNQVKDQKTDITVGGDVTAKGNNWTAGIVNETSNGGVTNIDISKGTVTVESEVGSTTGVSMNSNGSVDDPEKVSTAKLTVGKDVTAKGKYDATGVAGKASNGSEVKIEVGGNVNAESENGSANALTISTTGENSKATATVAGNVTASGNGDYWENAYAIRMTNYGGEAIATITGDVKSTGIGVSAYSQQYQTSFSLTEQEIAAIKDKLILVMDNEDGKYYSYTAENGDRYEYYEYNDGSSHGYKEVIKNYKGTTNVTVGGSVVAENNEGNRSVTGISAYNQVKDQKTDIKIGGDVTAKGNGSATGVVGSSSNGGTVDIDISKGAVTAESEAGSATGVNMNANGSFDNPSTTNLIIGKDVSVKGKDSATGVVGKASNGGMTNIDISQGAVTAESENSSATGVSIEASGDIDNPRKASAANVIIGKDVRASGKAYVIGLSARSTFGSTLNIQFAGDVTADSSDSESKAVSVNTVGEQSKVKISVGGDVKASAKSKNEWLSDAVGIKAFNQGGQETIEVAGDVSSSHAGIVVTSENYQNSIPLNQQEIDAIKDKLVLVSDNSYQKWYTYTDNDGYCYYCFERNDGSWYGDKHKIFSKAGITNIVVDGNVTVESDSVNHHAIGISAEQRSPGQKMDIAIGGNVTVMGNEKSEGIAAYNSLSTEDTSIIDILVNGTVDSDGNGLVIDSYGYNKSGDSSNDLLGSTIVTILDDVTANGVGISIWDGQNTSVLVDGTVSGGEFPISLGQNIDTDSLILTVWAIEPDENGAVVGHRDGWDSETGKRKYVEDEEAEANVQYIIRVEQPKKGGALYTEGTTEYQGYDVAHEGDTVYLKAELKPGFRIVKAFYDTEKTLEMQKEGKNVFSMVVPRGGAVSLSALLSNFQKPVSERPANPVYTENANYDKYVAVDRNESNGAKVTVKINGNGGTINGKASNTLLISAGKTVLLPEVDEREGVEFLGWYASKCDRNSKDWVEPAADAQFLPSNTEVKVMEKTVFTAIWKTKSR